MNIEEYEKLTYKGRQICEAEEFGDAYIGSCSIELHVEQLNDPGSWIHSSVERWAEAASPDKYESLVLKIKELIVESSQLSFYKSEAIGLEYLTEELENLIKEGG